MQKDKIRNLPASPSKKNFLELSRHYSLSTVNGNQTSIFESNLNNNQTISASLKKLAGKFSIKMNLQSER